MLTSWRIATSLKNNDVFFECECGMNSEYRVTENIKFNDARDAISWKGVNTNTNEIVEFMIREDYQHYGPKIYKEPQYVSMNENDELGFQILDGRFIKI